MLLLLFGFLAGDEIMTVVFPKNARASGTFSSSANEGTTNEPRTNQVGESPSVDIND